MKKDILPEQVYRKVSTKKLPPKAGWYDTDKGNLFWYELKRTWSCRDDKVSEEYPAFWYERISLSPVGEVTDEEIDQEVSLMTNYITSHSLAFSEGAKWMRDRLNRGIEWDSGEIIGRVKDRHKELRGKGHHWSSFYHGWLEGRVDMLKLSKMRSQALSSTEKEDVVDKLKKEIEELKKMYTECFETFIPDNKADEATIFLSTYGSGLAKDMYNKQRK